MSDTPLTDAEVLRSHGGVFSCWVPDTFAQNQEREISAIKNELNRIHGGLPNDDAVEAIRQLESWSTNQTAELEKVRAELAEARAGQTLDLRQLECLELITGSKLKRIKDKALSTRKAYSDQGHNCDFKAAIDSIADIASVDIKELAELGKAFNTLELKTIDALRAQLEQRDAEIAELKAHLSGRAE